MKLSAQVLLMVLLLALVTNTAVAQSTAPAQQKQLEFFKGDRQ